MLLLSRLFLFLAERAERREKKRHDAYLAQATDLYDLEFRMRKLDRDASVSHPAWMSQY